MDSMEHEEDMDEDDVAAGEALTGPLNDAFSGLQGRFFSTPFSNLIIVRTFLYTTATWVYKKLVCIFVIPRKINEHLCAQLFLFIDVDANSLSP